MFIVNSLSALLFSLSTFKIASDNVLFRLFILLSSVTILSAQIVSPVNMSSTCFSKLPVQAQCFAALPMSFNANHGTWSLREFDTAKDVFSHYAMSLLHKEIFGASKHLHGSSTSSSNVGCFSINLENLAFAMTDEIGNRCLSHSSFFFSMSIMCF